MAGLTLSSGVKDKVGYRLQSAAYSSCSAYIQSLIDGEGASALTELETWSQWFTLTTASTNAPNEWEPWFIDRIVARIECNAHPEKAEAAEKRAERSKIDAMLSYARLAMTYNPGTTTEAFVYTVQNIRNYVLSHCLRLQPRLLPDVAAVDGEIDSVLGTVYAKAQWPFRRRPVTMLVTRTAFTGGTYTDATKTISGLTGIGTGLASGTRCFITDGTGANLRESVVASSTATTIVLLNSLGSAADGQTDIEGFYVTVTFEGLQSGESVDSIASVRFYYTDANYESQRLCWLAADEFAKVRSTDNNATGRPYYFRNHQVAPATMVWMFSPIPDQDYVLRGEVLVQTPAAPVTATATTAFDSFSRKFLSAMRKMVLSQVLTSHGRHNEPLSRQSDDEMESLFPIYADMGNADAELGVRDVYQDANEVSGGTGYLGGRGY